MFKTIFTSLLLAGGVLLAMALPMNSFATQELPFAVAAGNGVSVSLYNAPGSCLNGAMRAEFVEGATRVPGCWKTDGKVVQVVFMDADVLVLPAAAFKPAQNS